MAGVTVIDFKFLYSVTLGEHKVKSVPIINKHIVNNNWDTMTNPRNKKTLEQFKSEIPSHLDIEITGEYVNTDTNIEYKCKHGVKYSKPWKILKAKHCCREGYYDSGVMWESNTKTLRHLREQALLDRSNIDVSETYIDTSGRYKKLANIRCLIHNEYYSSITGKKIGLCPICNYERNIEQLKSAAPIAWQSLKDGVFVSKSETKWLDELGVVDRQVWLEDVKYKVDGYDPNTNTVYLYHGRFWHGCPETYNPEHLHPIVKIKMKDLYEKTMEYENKILQAGYKLVTKWGT
jgi:hypothetical protein